ncbi:tRNA1(Val) (adenine(37)-N6)-methyltransferase [Lentibacter sp. XHP0401]|uniref:tRNA1(Val) (adenine(37)-N6)-methyltransferase n=1 Tax=Lentibacter sp. XHP0401 TaxID=2984334 RepID=UPI0021E880C2|nr:methyltransferase [Lentibacter sp. XHP0401]MCV2894409.1 methyltransferase [Lentibacter sp. XHP0401]
MSTSELTHDAFLGGRLKLWQPKQGYRAGVDPVLLAATISAKAGESVLDLGCGAGAAALCLGTRIEGLDLHGLEIQPFYADLALKNASENRIALTVHRGNVNEMPASLKERRFNHVLTNPPYFDRGTGSKAPDEGRETALGGASLPLWLEAAARRLAPKGYLTLICRTERVPELLTALPDYLGSIELWPILPRTEQASQLVLLRARHSGKAAFRLHAGLVMHEGTRHMRDAESYAPNVSAVLRNAAALPFPKI